MGSNKKPLGEWDLLARLTSKEWTVLRSLLAGNTEQAEIAQATGLAISTVRCHLHHIRAKLYLRDTKKVILFAVACGMTVTASWEKMIEVENA